MDRSGLCSWVRVDEMSWVGAKLGPIPDPDRKFRELTEVETENPTNGINDAKRSATRQPDLSDQLGREN